MDPRSADTTGSITDAHTRNADTNAIFVNDLSCIFETKAYGIKLRLVCFIIRRHKTVPKVSAESVTQRHGTLLLRGVSSSHGRRSTINPISHPTRPTKKQNHRYLPVDPPPL